MTAAIPLKWNLPERIPFALIALLVLLAPAVSRSAEWRVNPIRLDFGREAKSGVITVFNEKPDKLTVQMKAMEWTQDSEGKDGYADTNDIVFFPKIIQFEKEGDRIIRAGTRTPAVSKEKTYRLFIEEIPGPRKAEGVTVAIALRIGVPIFVKPLKEEQKGEIGPVGMSKGVVGVPVRNTGNVHFVVQSVVVKGKNGKGEEIFSRELSGWYLLAGITRRYETAVPAEVCGNLAVVEVEVKAGKFVLSGKVDADQAKCAP
jgi:fimbrial chaperone protein